jgi:hypothetical protein
MDFLNDNPWLIFYLAGCVIAFALSLIALFFNMLAGFSIKARNLRQVGMRISWTTGLPKEMGDKRKKEDEWTLNWEQREPWYSVLKFGLSILFLAIMSVQSWLSVVWIPIHYLINIIKTFGVPQDVKDARWRLQNILFDFDGVIRMLAAIAGKPVDLEERAQLLDSLKARNLITESEYDRLMKRAETKTTA